MRKKIIPIAVISIMFFVFMGCVGKNEPSNISNTGTPSNENTSVATNTSDETKINTNDSNSSRDSSSLLDIIKKDDSKKKIKQVDRYSCTDTDWSYNILYYDSDGNLVFTELVNIDTDAIVSSGQFFYDDAGNVVKSIVYDSTNAPIEKRTYEYDSYGNMTKVIYMDNTGLETSLETKYSYDSNGQILLIDRVYETEEFEYDELGRITSNVHTSYTGAYPVVNYEEYYDYLENGVVMHEILVGKNYCLDYTYYDEEGRIKSVMGQHDMDSNHLEFRLDYFYDNDRIISVKSYEYNALAPDEWQLVQTYEYMYNENGDSTYLPVFGTGYRTGNYLGFETYGEYKGYEYW